MHSYQPGAIVTVFNCTTYGRFIIEGRARIRVRLPAEECYLVSFIGDEPDEVYERFIDPAGQANPRVYVAQLNNERLASAARLRA
jgi:hypothetical protein